MKTLCAKACMKKFFLCTKLSSHNFKSSACLLLNITLSEINHNFVYA